MLANEITLDRVEVPVSPLRSQDLIVAEINTLGAKAKQASDKADQYRATRRQNISELHKRWPDEWLQIVKEQCNIGRSEAYKQLAIADGRTTEEIEREKTAGRTEKARRNNPLGSGLKNAEKRKENQESRPRTDDVDASTDERKAHYEQEDEDCDTDAQVAPNAGKSATVVDRFDFDDWNCSDGQKALAYAFMQRAEKALAAANYPKGLLTPHVLERVSAVAVAWTKLSKELHEEYAELELQAAGE